MLEEQPVRDLLGRVPQAQPALHLPAERTVDRETTRLEPARTTACRTLSDHSPVTTTTPVAGDLPRDRRHRTADPPAIPLRLLPDAIPSTISSRSSNDRRTLGINSLQLADHHQESNKPSVAVTGWERGLKAPGLVGLVSVVQSLRGKQYF